MIVAWADHGDAEEEKIEALHLSIILRALGKARHKPGLMSFYVAGPAFSGPDHLRCLWKGEGHGEIRELRDIYNDAAAADEAALLDESTLHTSFFDNRDRHDQRDRHLRQLTIMESALVDVAQLKCFISEEEIDGSFVYAVVEQAHLYLGDLSAGTLLEGRIVRKHGDGPGRLLKRLAEQSTWPKLRDLHLEVKTDEKTLLNVLFTLVPTLRHLAPSNVTLVPSQGTWESTFIQITTVLQERIIFKETGTFSSKELQEVQDGRREPINEDSGT